MGWNTALGPRRLGCGWIALCNALAWACSDGDDKVDAPQAVQADFEIVSEGDEQTEQTLNHVLQVGFDGSDAPAPRPVLGLP